METENNTDYNKFFDLLNANHQWPTDYLFKFIGTPEDTSSIVKCFSSDAIVRKKLSSKGKYLSISISQKVNNAMEVLALYQKVKCKHKNVITI